MADLVRPGASASGPLNSDALPQNYDLVMYKGDYFSLYVTVKDTNGNPVNISTRIPKAALKYNYEDQSPTYFDCVLTGTTGQILLSMPSATTATLLPGSYIYDLQLTDSTGKTRTFLTGDVTVYNEVTT